MYDDYRPQQLSPARQRVEDALNALMGIYNLEPEYDTRLLDEAIRAIKKTIPGIEATDDQNNLVIERLVIVDKPREENEEFRGMIGSIEEIHHDGTIIFDNRPWGCGHQFHYTEVSATQAQTTNYQNYSGYEEN